VAHTFPKPTITNSIFAYNDTTEAYDVTGETGFNTTAYTKWMVEYRISVAGTQMVLMPGRIYMTELSNFAVTKAYIDSVQVTVGVDRDSTDDGQVGYYASYTTEWRTGTHYVQVYLQSTDTPTGDFKLTLVDYSACVNDDLIWWTYEYASLSTQT